MHKSLTPGVNRRIILSTAAGATVLLAIFRDSVFTSSAAGALTGVAAGLLQRRSLQRDAMAYAVSTTALEVRRVMVSSSAGKMAIALGWLCALGLLVPSATSQPLALAPAVWFAGYLAFMSARDVLAYSALRYVSAATVTLGHQS